MDLKFNKKFESLVGRDFSIEAIKPCKTFLFIKCDDVLLIEGLYYFSRFKPTIKRLPPLDSMIYEYDTNCLRVDDLTNKKVSNTEAFSCGLSLIKELVNRLQNSFGKGFEVILSYNYQHCYIRFYKIREGINNVMSEDLESFKREAILRVVF